MTKAETILREEYERSRDSQEDERAFRTASVLDRTLFQLGKWEEVAELRKQAIRDLERGTTTKQANSVGLALRQFHLADILMRSGKKENIEQARETLRNTPAKRAVEHTLAMLEAQQGHYAEAIRRLKEISAGNHYFDYDLALVALQTGDTELAGPLTQKLIVEAQQWIERGSKSVGEYHPELRRLHWLRGWYYVLVGDSDNAETELKKVFGPAFDGLNASEGLFDNINLWGANSLLGECMLHKPKPDFQLAEDYLLKAEEIQNLTPRHLGSPSRWRRDMRTSHLQRLVDLDTAWEKHETEAAHWKRKLDELKQSLLDDFPQDAVKVLDDAATLKAEHP